MIRWSEIDTVLLDMDGTLLDLHFDNHFWRDHLPRRYAEKHGLTLDAARKQLTTKFQTEEGTLNWYSTAYWSRTLELDIPALKQEVAHLIQVRPEVRPFLLRISELGKRVLLVTNAHHESLQIKMAITRIDQALHQIHSTHDIGLAKEQPGFWEKFARQETFEPARTLLVDDNLDVLRNARRHGIRHLLAIHQPDSKAPPKDCADFTPLRRFGEITPE
ncbi:MAG: GMP/IMP nucleotidase [Gammaproteobacteria bacterium]|nr:GMP/IMP nucleotidase [Gammaproteobacteria bacterium]